MEQRSQTDIDDDRRPADDAVSDQGLQTARNSQGTTKITIVIPLHNEEENIKAVVEGLLQSLSQRGFEPTAFLVDDGSTDDSLAVVRKLAEEDARVRFISFSRNFGKEAAIMAGLSECGDDFDLLAYMDSDGQHTSSDLLRLIDAAQDPDVDIVCGVRTSRDYQTRRQQRMTRAFYRLYRRLSDAPIDEGAGDFNVMRPKVVRALRQLREEHPFMKGLVGWVGFRKKLLPINIEPRAGGSAKSSTKKMVKLALGAILSFSAWPLRAWSMIGMISALIAVTYLLIVVVQTVAFGRDIPGYATTIVLLLGIGGLQLLSIGIVGEYIARIYDASKNRPRYIIRERV